MQTITISTPSENLIVSQNGTAQPQTQESSNALEKLLKANTTLAVWLIFLGLGGGLLALYYIRIGYLPEMEWNAALVYLFVCSVWGGVIGLALTISLYLPGVIWCEIIIFETTLDNHLTFYADHDDPSGKRLRRKEPCIRSIMRYLGIPFAVALLLSHIGLRVSGIPLIEPIDSYLIVAAIILAGTLIYCGPQHLCDVQILSRMGDHYFVRIGGKINITLPKTDVIAIRRLEVPESPKH